MIDPTNVDFDVFETRKSHSAGVLPVILMVLGIASITLGFYGIRKMFIKKEKES